MLASLCGEQTEPIESLATNANLSEWTRGAAIRAHVILFANDRLARRELVDFLKGLFEGELERERSNAWDVLVTACAEARIVELLPAIEVAFNEGLVTGLFIDLEGIRAEVASPLPIGEKCTHSHFNSLVTNAEAEMKHWACFNPDPDSQARRSLAAAASAKIGRNDPCPCGSGKKYKKCCLNRELIEPLLPSQTAPLSDSRCPEIDALFIEGFCALAADNEAGAIAPFTVGWAAIRERIPTEANTLRKMELALGSVFLADALVYAYGSALQHAAYDDPGAAAKGVSFSAFLVAWFHAESGLFHEKTRAQLGEFKFLAGEPTQGEKTLSKLILDLPHRSVGYAYLADALGWQRFAWNHGNVLDRTRARKILEEALARPVEDAPDYDLEYRLEDLAKAASGA